MQKKISVWLLIIIVPTSFMFGLYIELIHQHQGTNLDTNHTTSNEEQEYYFKKDEYCRKTYSESFVRDYEKQLVGESGNEWEFIKLVDIFYSPTFNKCLGVYDYSYINEEYDNIDEFERRIANALSASNILYSFNQSWIAKFSEGERDRYEKRMEELKSPIIK